MASSADKNPPEDWFLKCIKCDTVFDEEALHPCLLPCLHTLCFQCCEETVMDDGVVCPGCFEQHVSTGGESCFIRDDSRQILLQRHKISSGKSLLCNACAEEMAAKRCDTCAEFLCQFCSDAHKRMIATKNHALVDLSQYVERCPEESAYKPTCRNPDHHRRELDQYCCEKTCEIPLCKFCFLESHRNHNVKSLQEVCTNKAATIRSLLEKFEDKNKKAKLLEGEIQAARENLKAKESHFMSEIDNHFLKCSEALNAKLRHSHKELRKTLEETCKEKHTLLSNQLQEVQAQRQKMEDGLRFGEKVLTLQMALASSKNDQVMVKHFTQISETKPVLEVDGGESILFIPSKPVDVENFDAVCLGKIITTDICPKHTTIELFDCLFEENCTFAKITLKDKHGNRLTKPDLDVKVEVKTKDGARCDDVRVSYNGSLGVYEAKVMPTSLEDHSVEVTVNDVKIEGNYVFEVESLGSSEDAENVVKQQFKDGCYLEGRTLSSELHVPPPTEKNKVLVKGMKSLTTKESLMYYLEARCTTNATDVIFGETSGTALVTLEHDLNIKDLQALCAMTPLEGQTVSIEPVVAPTCVLVMGLPPDITKETLELYFENKRRSRGTDVTGVEVYEDGTALVHFLDWKVAKAVSEHKHTINYAKLEVCLYYECLGKPRDKTGMTKYGARQSITMEADIKPFLTKKELSTKHLKLPDPVGFPHIDGHIFSFLLSSKQYKLKFEEEVAKVGGRVLWPGKGTSEVLQIACLNKMDEAGSKKWKESVITHVQSFLTVFTVQEVNVAQELWSDVVKSLQQIEIKCPEGVTIFLNKENVTVILAGHAAIVRDLKAQIKRVMASLEKLQAAQVRLSR